MLFSQSKTKTRKDSRTLILSKNVEISDLLNNTILNFLLKTTIGNSFPSGGVTRVALLYSQKKETGTFFNITGVRLHSIEELSNFIHKNLENVKSDFYNSVSIRFR